MQTASSDRSKLIAGNKMKQISRMRYAIAAKPPQT
jgi:hypothetical protein